MVEQRRNLSWLFSEDRSNTNAKGTDYSTDCCSLGLCGRLDPLSAQAINAQSCGAACKPEGRHKLIAACQPGLEHMRAGVLSIMAYLILVLVLIPGD